MKIIAVFSLLFLLILAGCAETEIANPASVYCEELGGTVIIERGFEGGEYGICVLPDGSECEEWALYKNLCGPNVVEKHHCTAEEKAAEICTMEYMPVCGYTSPGAKIKTYGNDCQACADKLVGYWIEGEC